MLLYNLDTIVNHQFSPRKTDKLTVNVDKQEVSELKYKLKISQEQSSGTNFITILKRILN